MRFDGKKTKRKWRNLLLEKLSNVQNPAQEFALAAICKSKGETEMIIKTESNEELALETVAKMRADEEGITYEKAYAKVLDTPEGEALYNKMQGQSAAEVQKSQKNFYFQRLEKAAKQKANETGRAYVECYNEVLNSSVGQELYEKAMCRG